MLQSGIIKATRVPGMAFAESPESLARTTEGTMFLDSKDHVLTAAGIEAALAAKDGAEQILIELH